MAVSYRRLLDDATALLYDASDTARIEAEVLMQHVIEQNMAWLIAYGDRIACAEHTQRFYDLVAQRRNGKPLAYIIGHRAFWTLDLFVDERVLIPRPDTETLIEHALSVLDKTAQITLLDLGAGSGAIALTLAKELPKAKVIAVDVQDDALLVAQRNAQHHKLKNVCFLRSHWYQQLGSQRFDLIAANPPYVDADDVRLKQGDLRFEPKSALIANDHGLSDLEHIISNAGDFLKPNAYLIVEHGYNQQDAVERLFRASGFEQVCCFKDINQHPRCTRGQLTDVPA